MSAEPKAGQLVPMTRGELESIIAIQMTAMRARKEAGALPHKERFVTRLVERLWQGGLRPHQLIFDTRHFNPPLHDSE